MLLKLNKAACYGELDRLTNFIEEVLKYSAEFTRPFENEDFISQLGEGGDWYLKISEKSVSKSREELFSSSKDCCLKMYNAFCNDIKFANTPDPDEFEFLIEQLDDDLKTILTNFLKPFYNYILGSKGFTDFERPDTELLTRKRFRRLHIQNNTDQCDICPACLGEIKLLDISRDDEDEFLKDSCADIEHYMPKSIYPALIVSSDNLIPICKSCNEAIKQTKDPIDIRKKGSINRIYLPYKDEGISEILVNVSGSAGNRKVCISAKDDAHPSSIPKINNFKRVYKLEEQWSPKLKNMYKHVVTTLASDIKVENRQVNEENVAIALKKIVQRAEWSEKSVANAFLEKVYTKWLLANRLEEICLAVYEYVK